MTHVSHSPTWLDALAEIVANCIKAHAAMGSLGFRYHHEDGNWEIIAYPTAIELIGGAEDGAVVLPSFSLDVQLLISAFEHIVTIHWMAQAFGLFDADPPHLSIEGTFQGHSIWLRGLIF